MKRKLQRVKVSQETLRTIFNDANYPQMVDSGQIHTEVVRSGHPSPPMASEPDCTYSQIVAYRDQDDNLVAEVHQYLRPDGTIGGSGIPDPKKLFYDGKLLTI